MASRRDLVLAGLALAAMPFAHADERTVWARLRKGGLAILMRHAATVDGLGDPPGYRLDDCATQRNLSEAGRADARRIGERFRAEGVPIARVLNSPWCRCRETAMLAFGRSEDWEPLASIFDLPQRDAEYTERVRKRIAQYARTLPGRNVVMVTHNVNIAAISRESVATGEMVLMRADGCCNAKASERLKV